MMNLSQLWQTSICLEPTMFQKCFSPTTIIFPSDSFAKFPEPIWVLMVLRSLTPLTGPLPRHRSGRIFGPPIVGLPRVGIRGGLPATGQRSSRRRSFWSDSSQALRLLPVLQHPQGTAQGRHLLGTVGVHGDAVVLHFLEDMENIRPK